MRRFFLRNYEILLIVRNRKLCSVYSAVVGSALFVDDGLISGRDGVVKDGSAGCRTDRIAKSRGDNGLTGYHAAEVGGIEVLERGGVTRTPVSRHAAVIFAVQVAHIRNFDVEETDALAIVGCVLQKCRDCCTLEAAHAGACRFEIGAVPVVVSVVTEIVDHEFRGGQITTDHLIVVSPFDRVCRVVEAVLIFITLVGAQRRTACQIHTVRADIEYCRVCFIDLIRNGYAVTLEFDFELDLVAVRSV